MEDLRLRIETVKSPYGFRVWLDDLEVTEFVSKLQLDVDGGKSPMGSVQLDLIPTSIEVDAEIAKVLTRGVVRQP